MTFISFVFHHYIIAIFNEVVDNLLICSLLQNRVHNELPILNYFENALYDILTCDVQNLEMYVHCTFTRIFRNKHAYIL